MPEGIPEPLDIELDVELAIRVHGFRWYELQTVNPRLVAYALCDPFSVGKDVRQVPAPQCRLHGFVFKTADGRQAQIVYHGMPQPTQTEIDALNLARFLARDRDVTFQIQLQVPKDDPNQRVLAAWYQTNGPDECPIVTCIASHQDTSLCRAIVRSALALLDVLGEKPPSIPAPKPC